MLTFRRHHPAAGSVPAWASAPVCAEYRASGLELRLIDLVELRDRSERAGFDDVEELEVEIDQIRDELVRLAEETAPLEPAA